MASPTYIVEILDKSLQPITRLQNFVPLNKTGDYLSYSSRLSDSGTARFRVATDDPVLTKYGNILQPWANHVRITRDKNVVFQGYIQDLPERNARYIEVRAYTYLEMLKKGQIQHDAVSVDGEDVKNYQSGTMAGAINALITEIRANATGLAIANITAGTIDNPLFPVGFIDAANVGIGGQAWTFTANFLLKFDFVDWHYILTAFGIYSAYDFELTTDLKLNFRKRLGIDRPELVFEYGQYGMIEDFNAPLDGKNQVNHILAIGADNNNNTIKVELPEDSVSITKYGRLVGVGAYNDVKNKALLGQRLAEDLRLNSTPDTELRIVLNQRAYPYGVYSLGDSATFRIHFGAIDFDGLREIIGIQTTIHNTGKEHITLTTNKPRIK